MDEGEFIEACKKHYSEKEKTMFIKALSFAKEKFSGELRLSGDSVFEHNLRVGLILVENSAEPEVVTAGILHSLIDCKKEILMLFGEEVWSMAEGVEEISEIKSKNQNLQAEAIKKILVTTLKDMRVLLIKLANRLDNLRTIDALPKEKQMRIAEETLEIYAPLAYRLGSERLKVQLEDLAFKILNPKKYDEINNYLKASRDQREKDVSHAIELIKETAEGKVSILKIKGRPKHIYSIYRKIMHRKIRLDMQYDLLGIRIIVPYERDCYALLAILHESFNPVEGKIKDYIAKPKPNFYRSIHTCVIMPGNKVVEIQIRTPEMDELAEEGLAAHWKYKGLKSDESFEKKMSWLRGVLDLHKNDTSKEFIEAAKVDVFGDLIYCYTPKGDIKELPIGATVLDFAFTVHEEVGKTAIGGRVNGKFQALKHELAKGDIIEIITNKNQTPRRSWLKFVKSVNARNKIRRFINQSTLIPAPHYRLPKKISSEEKAYLVDSIEHPGSLCILAKCCRPLPGDDIIGITTKRRIISVHKPECKLALKEENRWTKVIWKDSFSQKIGFIVDARERSGLLADLLHTIAAASFEVKEAKAKLVGPDDMQCSFLVIPKSLDRLMELVKRIRKVKGVMRIYFES